MTGVRRSMMVVAAATLLGGCASGQSAHMKRLQSQVGLLDERVSQLERTGGGWQGESAASAAQGELSAAAGPVVPAAAEPAKTASAPAEHTSGKGSTRQVQQALKNAGFYQGNVDGKMGPMTKEAVKEFQRVHGLKDDGVVGKQTWTKLSSYLSLASSEASKPNEAVK